MIRFRISKINKSWVLQEFSTGGKIHPVTKMITEDSWLDLGYYGKLKDLVVYLLDKSIILPDNATGKDILQAIKLAEQNILKQLKSLEIEPK